MKRTIDSILDTTTTQSKHKRKRVTFNVPHPYIKSCSITYYAILESYVSLTNCKTAYHCMDLQLIKLIAEFSSTKYEQCLECNKVCAYTECTDDFHWDWNYSAPACYDEHDNIRYFLNHLSEFDEEDEPAGPLCIKCGSKYQCKQCGYQPLSYNAEENTDRCSTCDKIFCMDCLTPINQNYRNNQFMCRGCCVINASTI